MKVIIRVNNAIEVVHLSKDKVDQFKNKQESLDIECTIEEFIADDLAELLQHEIDNGKYGLFNY